MSILALSSPSTDIVYETRQLVDALNASFPLRRFEIEMFPTTFCQQLIQETGRLKALTTMPRKVFDSLFEAATRCVGGDTRSSTVRFGGLSLDRFQLDPAFPSSLFQNGKAVVPHDSVFMVLYYLHAHAISHQLDIKSIVADLFAFIPPKVVQRYLSFMDRAASETLPESSTSLLAMKMCTFGPNLAAAASSLWHSASTRLHPQGSRVLPSLQPSTISHQDLVIPKSDSVATSAAEDQGDFSHGSVFTRMSEPSTPRAQARSRRTTIPSAPLPSSPLASTPYDLADSSHSPHSPNLTKRLFQDEVASRQKSKKSRVLDASNGKQQSVQTVAKSSKAGSHSDRRRQRANRSMGKRTEYAPSIQEDDVQSDAVPQTSPISKLMPGSFLSRGERADGSRPERVAREKENVSRIGRA